MVKAKSEKGFSLLELMLCMFIALILSQQVYSFMQTLQLSQNELHDALEHDEGRQISLLIIKRFIDIAGHINFNNGTDTTASTFPADRFPLNAFVFGEDNNSSLVKSKNGSDSLHLRFETPKAGEFRDCKNTILENNKIYEISFYIDRFSDLRCLGVLSKTNVRSSAVLAHRIQDLKIEYAYFNASALRIEFCDADCIETKNAWNKVKGIRLSITSQCSISEGFCETNFQTSTHTLTFKNTSIKI